MRSSLNKKILQLTCIMAILLSPQTYADSQDTAILRKISEDVAKLVADAKLKWDEVIKLITTPTPNAAKNSVANQKSIAANSNPALTTTTAKFLKTDLYSSLSGTDTANTSLTELAKISKSDLSSFEGDSDLFKSDIINFNTLFSKDAYPRPKPNSNYESLNLINQVIHTFSQGNSGNSNTEEYNNDAAARYIQFLYQFSNLPKDYLINLKDYNLTADQLINLYSRPKFSNYFVALRSYVANQSLGLSNLYTIYNRHRPIPNLGKEIGMKDGKKVINDASIADVEDYLAKKRLTDEKWLTDMEEASPASVLREILYVLTEIRYEIHQSRQDSERVLATLSAIELQALTQNRTNLMLIQREAIDQINSVKNNQTGIPK